jgi:hypothetical protein
MLITDDVQTEDVETGQTSLEFYLNFTASGFNKAEKWAQVGNYLLTYDISLNESRYFTIMDYEEVDDDCQIKIYAEDAGMSIINEIVDAYEATSAMSIAQYFNTFASASGFQIGLNEMPDRKRTLQFQSESSLLERLQSIASGFGGEIGFSFEINNFTVGNKYVNFYKIRGQGEDDTPIILRKGFEIGAITVKQSVTGVCTQLYVTGGTPERAEGATTDPPPIGISGLTPEDSDLKVYGNRILASVSAFAEWSKTAAGYTSSGHITKRFHYDTLSPTELLARAETALNKSKTRAVNYEAELLTVPRNLSVGGAASIVSNRRGLVLTARLLHLERSRANKTAKGTFGEYTIV